MKCFAAEILFALISINLIKAQSDGLAKTSSLMSQFEISRQHTDIYCGPAVIESILRYYNDLSYTQDSNYIQACLASMGRINFDGISVVNLVKTLNFLLHKRAFIDKKYVFIKFQQFDINGRLHIFSEDIFRNFVETSLNANIPVVLAYYPGSDQVGHYLVISEVLRSNTTSFSYTINDPVASGPQYYMQTFHQLFSADRQFRKIFLVSHVHPDLFDRIMDFDQSQIVNVADEDMGSDECLNAMDSCYDYMDVDTCHTELRKHKLLTRK